MCLEKAGDIKKAEKPIIVYKTTNDWGITKETFTSRHKGWFEYKVGEETRKETINVSYCKEVDKGYHSYIICPKKHIYDETGIFIIPTGADYVEGINPDESPGRVASSMIYIGPIGILNYLKVLWLKYKGITTKHV